MVNLSWKTLGPFIGIVVLVGILKLVVPWWAEKRPQDFDDRIHYVKIPEGLEYIATEDNHDYGYSCDTCHKWKHPGENDKNYIIAGDVVISLTGIGEKGLEIQEKEGCKGCHNNPKNILEVTRTW